MRTDCSQDSFEFGTVEGRRVVGAFDGGQITSHAGDRLTPTDTEICRSLRPSECFSLKLGVSRLELLETVERQALKGLPSEPY